MNNTVYEKMKAIATVSLHMKLETQQARNKLIPLEKCRFKTMLFLYFYYSNEKFEDRKPYFIR